MNGSGTATKSSPSAQNNFAADKVVRCRFDHGPSTVEIPRVSGIRDRTICKKLNGCGVSSGSEPFDVGAVVRVHREDQIEVIEIRDCELPCAQV